MEREIYGADGWDILQRDFSSLKGNVFLDHAGSTLASKQQLATVFDDLSLNAYGNPHSRHFSSKLSSDVIDQIRFLVLDHLHTDINSYEVVFTSGATQSLKIIAESFDFGASDQVSGCFAYLKQSHTSVVGMRECVLKNNIPTYHISLDVAKQLSPDTKSSFTNTVPQCNSLFVFPAQCNFSGYKFPLDWIQHTRNGALNELIESEQLEPINTGYTYTKSGTSNWFTMLDAASYCSTNSLDLSKIQPDFVCLSFYKIFGYPTGLGALLVHKRAQHTLTNKTYFGGGTVQMYLSSANLKIPRPQVAERFEDGTCNFLGIIALRHGFEYLRRTTKSMDHISRHTFALARYTFMCLDKLCYQNGTKLAEIYSETNYTDRATQGGILTFNLKRPGGDYIGYGEVEKVLAMHDIMVRTGCFCNPAACQRYLALSDEDIKSQLQI